MTVHIGLLRGINVGGKKKVAMADLHNVLAGLGLENPRTLLQSGNVVFGSSAKTQALENLLEATVKAELKVESDFLVRTAREWDAIIAANAFPDEARSDPSHLAVLILKAAPEKNGVDALQKAIKGRETVKWGSQHVYAYYPDGMGNSNLTLPVMEKALGARGTARNWNTVLKLAALAQT